MKKFLAVILSIVMACSLCACGYDFDFDIDSDGNVTVGVIEYYSAEEYNMLLSSGSEDGTVAKEYTTQDLIDEAIATGVYVGTRTIDDVVYVGMIAAAPETYTASEIAEETGDSFVTATEFVLTTDSQDSLSSTVTGDTDDYADAEAAQYAEMISQMMTIAYNVTMPSKIVLTNGTLSADRKTVTFSSANLTDTVYYAYTADSDQIITFSGIKANNTTAKSKVKVVTYDKVKSISVNGEVQKGKTINLTKDGTYTIEVATKYSTKTITFTKDSVKPVVNGVENGGEYTGSVKITYSDKDTGIASAKLGKKKIKSGATVSEPGNYTLTVTDKAGNKTTVKFTIK